MLKRTLWFALISALVIAGCRATGQTGTQEFTAAYPDTDPAPVALDIATGTLTLAAADIEGITGKVTTNVDAWAVTTGLDAGRVLRVTQGSSRNPVIPNAENLWDVKLGGDKALNLTINTTSAGGTLDLTGLMLPQFAINGGTGAFTLNYAAPASVSGGSALITQTSGDVTVTGLLNSGAARFESTTTSGVQTFEFTGAGLAEDIRTRIVTSAGNVVLRIPAGLPVRIAFATTTGNIRNGMPASYTAVSRSAFETESYANRDQPRLLIEVQTITGSLRVLELGGL